MTMNSLINLVLYNNHHKRNAKHEQVELNRSKELVNNKSMFKQEVSTEANSKYRKKKSKRVI